MNTPNKPAFPTTKPLDSWGDPNQGMSLREWYAGLAMQGILANPNFLKGVEEFMTCSDDILFGIERMSKLVADKMVEEKQQ